MEGSENFTPVECEAVVKTESELEQDSKPEEEDDEDERSCSPWQLRPETILKVDHPSDQEDESSSSFFGANEITRQGGKSSDNTDSHFISSGLTLNGASLKFKVKLSGRGRRRSGASVSSRKEHVASSSGLNWLPPNRSIPTDNSIFKCAYCMESFDSRPLLEAHLVKHSGVKPYHCTDCYRCFRFEYELKAHSCRNVKPVSFVCNDCNHPISFSNSVVGLTQKIVSLPHCLNCSHNVDTLLNTHAMFNDDMEEEHFICNDCGRSFHTKKYLSRHIAYVHSNTKNYECPVCNKCFKTMKDLRNHFVFHTDIKPYKCTRCTATFYQKAGLKRHSSVHMSEKEFKCPYCDVRFKYKGSVTCHLKRNICQGPP
uniref:C2H2-type domain-containing protein n=1 Tax=Timema genevievae TaxID=629358 RepID=A0A7R9PHA9_TIMGE|nr:unnamed protein product [Timema genevievae]